MKFIRPVLNLKSPEGARDSFIRIARRAILILFFVLDCWLFLGTLSLLLLYTPSI